MKREPLLSVRFDKLFDAKTSEKTFLTNIRGSRILFFYLQCRIKNKILDRQNQMLLSCHILFYNITQNTLFKHDN